MRVTYRVRHMIGRFACYDTEHVVHLERTFEQGGLLYGYKDRYNVVAIAKEDIIKTEED